MYGVTLDLKFNHNLMNTPRPPERVESGRAAEIRAELEAELTDAVCIESCAIIRPKGDPKVLIVGQAPANLVREIQRALERVLCSLGLEELGTQINMTGEDALNLTLKPPYEIVVSSF